MKNLHFTKSLFPLLLLFVLSTSCEKSTPKELVSINQNENVKSLKQVPEVENMVLANFKDKDVIDLIEKLKSTKLNQPITYYRAEMHVTNNYFNDQQDRPNERYSNPRPHPDPQAQPHTRNPEPRNIEPELINRIFNNNANNIEIELNYLYNPERGRFNIIQNPVRNNIIDYIYNIITTMPIPGVSEENINQLHRGSYTNLRDHIIPECTQCTISLEEFSDTTEVIVLPCRHAFIVDAIQRWLRTNTTCPTCRERVVAEARSQIG